MSFGFIINDLGPIVGLVDQLRKQLAQDPCQLHDIANELRGITIALQDTEIVLSNCENEQQKSNVQQIASECHSVLLDLEEALGKYTEPRVVDQNNSDTEDRASKRLKCEPEDIRQLQHRLTANTNLLIAFILQMSSQTLSSPNEGIGRTNMQQDDPERLTALDWVTTVDYGTKQRDTINQKQIGTGKWFLDAPEFQAWVNSPTGTLFCPGVPGAGKTMLMANTIDYLRTRFRDDQTVGIAYVYCDYRRAQDQGVEYLLASLLKQVAQTRPQLPDSVKLLYDRHFQKRSRPSLEELSKALQSVVASYSKAFIIVDALDECPTCDDGRSRFLAEIFNLQTSHAVSFLGTSKFTPNILNQFSGCPYLKIRAPAEDIWRYVDGHLSQLRPFVGSSPNLKEDIAASIVKAADGVFLLAKLYLHSLSWKLTPKEIRKALAKLPFGCDQAYREIMKRIERQSVDQKKLAKQVLSWITCAPRPLRAVELQHALAVEAGELEFDEDNLPQLEDMVTACAGLVTIDQESDIIGLVHYTAQDFLQRSQEQWFPKAEFEITQICVTYLSYVAFGSESCRTNTGLVEILRSNPLYRYAAINWAFHARKAMASRTEIGDSLQSGNTAILTLVLGFLSHDNPTWATWRAMIQREDTSWPLRVAGVNLPGPLYYAVKLGLMDVAIAMIQVDSCDVNGTSSLGTALTVASSMGSVGLTALLLEDGADTTLKDRFGRAPIHLACQNGHAEVVKLLLEYGPKDRRATTHMIKGNDVANLCDDALRTPLHYSVNSAQIECTELLLQQGAQISADIENMTALHHTVAMANEQMAQCLLDAGVDKNTGVKRKKWQPIRTADHVTYVLDRDYAPDPGVIADGWLGLTALHYAALTGSQRMTKFFLDRGANPNYVSEYGETPLHLALKQDVFGPEYPDCWNRSNCRIESALSRSGHHRRGGTECTEAEATIEEQRSAVIDLLLDQSSTDVNARDIFDNSPLHSVMFEHIKSPEIVRKLVERGADVSARNIQGQTALHLACSTGNLDSVAVLISHGADIDTEDLDGLNAIHYAARSGSSYTILHVVNACPATMVPSRDKQGRNILHHLAQDAIVLDDALIRYLVESGIDVNELDRAGMSPLALCLTPTTSTNLHWNVRLFLQLGSDPLFKTRDEGLSLAHLHAKSYRVSVRVLKALAEFGVDLHSIDNQGRTILHHCAIEASLTPESLEFLCNRVGLDKESQDEQGRTPRQLAVKMMQKEHHPDRFDPDRWARVEKLLLGLDESENIL